MSKTIRGHDLRVAVVMALITVLLLVALVVAVEPAATTSVRDGNPAIDAMSGTGGSNVTHDPYIDRHAEVVAHYHQDSLR
jgi:hypothetical protein